MINMKKCKKVVSSVCIASAIVVESFSWSGASATPIKVYAQDNQKSALLSLAESQASIENMEDNEVTLPEVVSGDAVNIPVTAIPDVASSGAVEPGSDSEEEKGDPSGESNTSPQSTEKPQASMKPIGTEIPQTIKPIATEQPTVAPAETEAPQTTEIVTPTPTTVVEGNAETQQPTATAKPLETEKPVETVPPTDIGIVTYKKANIVYHLNNGTNHLDNPDNVLLDGTLHPLKDPKRKAYTFVGWYADSSYKKRVYKVGGTSDDNVIVVYAKWTKTSVKKAEISNVKALANRKIRVKVKKVANVVGYEYVYSTSASFAKKTRVRARSNEKVLTRLKKRKYYYVKVRSYKLDSCENKIFGAYSKPVKCKVK